MPPDTISVPCLAGRSFDFGQAAIPAAPAARGLSGAPVLCIQGIEEDDSLCPSMTMTNVTRVSLPRGHMLNFDPDRLYAAIAPALRRVAAAHYR
ncbi:MAG: AcvB/VirJ family lysyl-phosphatidylglycerol hydrolase [Pseudomonadota bacterium]